MDQMHEKLEMEEVSVLTNLLEWEISKKLHNACRQLSRLHVLGLAAAAIGSVVVMRYLVGRRKRLALTALRKKKQKQRQLAFDSLEQLINLSVTNKARADEISKIDILELVSQLKSGKLSPSEVIEAYQRKAFEAHKRTNCLVEPLLNATLDASALQSQTGERGPLYGVPVSVKDCFGIKGYDCTIGCSKWIDRPFDDDAVIIKVVKMQGGVPFVKTNIPQTMISWESTNPIFGSTTTPHDVTRSAGGSSGGEAALIAAGGSVLGIGSDIGGSVRIPASVCGICALKPTGNRLSKKGKHPILSGQTTVTSSIGPMSNNVDGLILFMKAVLVPEMYRLDPSVPNLPFREEILNDKRFLTIGYYEYNGIVEAVPAMVRGVREAKAALEALGHKVVPWHCMETRSAHATKIWWRGTFADGLRELAELLRYDAVNSAVGSLYAVGSIPLVVRKILYHLLWPFKSALRSTLQATMGLRDVTEFWELTTENKKFQTEVMADWQLNGLDGVICPSLGTTAVPCGTGASLEGVTTYLGVYNVLDFCAGTLPVSSVNAADVVDMERYPTRHAMNSNYRRIRKAMQGIEGLPVNVQVVTLPWQEELCLRIMKDIETGIKSKRAI